MEGERLLADLRESAYPQQQQDRAVFNGLCEIHSALVHVSVNDVLICCV